MSSKKYYTLNLNNARYMIDDDNNIYNGCFKILPKKTKGGEIINYDDPFLMFAEKKGDNFYDFVSGKKVIFDDDLESCGNFGIRDNYLINFDKKYLDYLESLDEDILDRYDEEARYILYGFEEGLSYNNYMELSDEEVSLELMKLDNPEVVSKYMLELVKIEKGIIAKEKALDYLEYRKIVLDRKSREVDIYEKDYIDSSRSSFKKIRKK